jgi:electron transfer flavoprotein beta subunit
MNIVTILKQVPDTEAQVQPDPNQPDKISSHDIKYILNPYDEFAVEEALAISETSDAEVIGVCIGSQDSETAIRTALAMGVDRAILISDPQAVNADIVTMGQILAEAIKPLDASLIFCGREWIDTQDDALAAIVAEYLGIPHVSNVGALSVDPDGITATREMDGGSLEITSSIPAVISCSKDLNEPRYPTLIKIKRAKNKEIKPVTLAELNLQIDSPRSRVKHLLPPPERAAGKKVSGNPETVAAEAAAWLSEEAKII